jgi:hypothetical protein
VAILNRKINDTFGKATEAHGRPLLYKKIK